jgi:eukaryotic-like serine/threonine-protein kinase
MLQIGDQFDHFQIQAHLAQGGSADIYTAVDLLTSRQVVLKIPSKLLSSDPTQGERFRRELEVTQRLDHPAIQKGLASGQFDRTPYLVTAWIDGKPMRDVINTTAPMPPEQALPLIRKIAEGLAYCHERDVIHRDMKPDNVLITTDGQPIIIDFGLTLTKDARRVTYANLTATAGTPEYMAPEQCEGQRGDARTDIYALGVMLYEVLTGKTPYAGDSSMVVMAGHLQGAIPRLDKENPRLSPQLAAVVVKALQKSPDDRYPTMTAFIEALDHPEQAPLAVLEKSSGVAISAPVWRSPMFMTVAVSALIIILILVLVLASQALRGAA